MSGLIDIGCVSADVGGTQEFYAGVLGLSREKGGPDGDASFVLPEREGGTPKLHFVRASDDARGRVGRGQVNAVGLIVPRDTFAFWRRRLEMRGIEVLGRAWAFREEHLCFVDSDGLSLSLVEDPFEGRPAMPSEPRDRAIRRVHSLEVHPVDLRNTERLLIDVLGFEIAGRDGIALRLRKGELCIDLIDPPRASPGTPGVGVVDHLTWRMPTGETARSMRSKLGMCGYVEIEARTGFDRDLAYFREPEGVLFAFAIAPESRPSRFH